MIILSGIYPTYIIYILYNRVLCNLCTSYIRASIIGDLGKYNIKLNVVQKRNSYYSTWRLQFLSFAGCNAKIENQFKQSAPVLREREYIQSNFYHFFFFYIKSSYTKSGMTVRCCSCEICHMLQCINPWELKACKSSYKIRRARNRINRFAMVMSVMD